MSAIARELNRATERLMDVSDTARLDAELLMSAALGIGRDKLLLDPPKGKVPPGFAEMVDRREAGEPVAYITGHRGFWTIDLEVGPGVLIPRPDSETLLVVATEHFRGTEGPKRILDLGTGPGTLLLAALDEWPRATGLGVDMSDTALDYAKRNASRIGIAERAELKKGDWARGVIGSFDLILCNPPYVGESEPLGPGVVEYEPAEALFAGPEGLDDYRRLIPQLPPLIAPGGLAVLEIGHSQADSVCDLLGQQGVSPFVREDLGGRPRAVAFSR